MVERYKCKTPQRKICISPFLNNSRIIFTQQNGFKINLALFLKILPHLLFFQKKYLQCIFCKLKKCFKNVYPVL